MKRDNVYIDNTPVEEALKRYMDQIHFNLDVETIKVEDALGRSTSEAVFAIRSSPHYHCAAMDGIAVLSELTMGASEKKPKTLQVNKDCFIVNTGNPLPKNCDSVIMIEDIVWGDDQNIQIIEPSTAWQHVRPVGEDIVTGDMILPQNHVIRPFDLGAIISGGLDKVKVFKKLTVGILPTGNEIVQNNRHLKVGEIIDSNSTMLKACLAEMGVEAVVYEVVKDELLELEKSVLKMASNHDLVLIIAGSSTGEKDYTASILAKVGKVLVHGVALKPGKPAILSLVNEKPVIGMPGYPVSTYIVFDTFVRPLISKWLNRSDDQMHLECVLSRRVVSSLKNEERVRVSVGLVENNWIATPLARNAGVTMSLVRADGLLDVKRLSEGIEANSKVKIRLFNPKKTIANRLVVTGSHDMLLDMVSNEMPLSSAHVGSFGGILALKNKECHLAPVHLLDESSGTYNQHLLDQYFKDEDVLIIKGVKRIQGLIVPKGNPKSIFTIEDLSRNGLVYINRQRGAGTRQLLDYHLMQLGIRSDEINGYHREVTTHMGVAVAVKSQEADVGLGIDAAARAMGLDFVPLCEESYDFITRRAFLNDERIKQFIEILKHVNFQNKMMRIGGYVFDKSGEIIERR